MSSRTVRILDILSVNNNIKVNLLAELLDVSQVTLRKDLDDLERKGIIHRSHGYACLDGANDPSKRMAFNHSVKRKIAKAAALTVGEGETVMIESGSCCALLAEELALAKKNITVITNSAFIAGFTSKHQNIKVILLGGCYQPESQVLVGPITVKCGQAFFAQKIFLGTDGFIPERGFTGGDYLRAETAAELSKCAQDAYILTESAKFSRHGAYSLIQLEKLTGVFTDDKIPKKAEASLIKNNVKVHKVPSVEEKLKLFRIPGCPPFLYTEKEE